MMANETDAERLSTQATAEAEFFDKVYADTDKKHSLQGYIIPAKFIDQVLKPKPHSLDDQEYAMALLGDLEGKSLLDYGAGDGWRTICFAKANANVWAIDISQKGVDLIRKKVHANGVSDLVTAEVRNCYATEFSSDKFDRIYGGGILHHLDIDASAQEIRRILHPQGVAVFCEPIRDTKVMDVIKAIVLTVTRKKSSEDTTEDESPLTTERIDRLHSYFGVVNYRYFNVLSSASLLIDSERLKRFLLRVDEVLMKIAPGFKKLGRAVVLELREPLRTSTD